MDTRLYKEDSRRLLLKHQRWLGPVLALFGLGYLALTTLPGGSEFVDLRLIFSGTLCLVGSLYHLGMRDQWELDLETRTYHRRGGFVLASKERHGTFDEIDGVILTRKDFGFYGWDSPETWLVQLAFKERSQLVTLESLRNESAAYYRLAHFARLMDLPAFDHTDGLERRVLIEARAMGSPEESAEEAHSALAEDFEPAKRAGAGGPATAAIASEPVATEAGDQVPADRARNGWPRAHRTVVIEAPPADSGLELRGAPGQEAILLPAVLPRQFLVFAGAVIAAALAVGAAYLHSAIESMPDRSGSLPAGVTLGLLWLALASGAGWVSWRFAGRRFQVERRGNFLRFSTMLLGRRRQTQLLHRREILEIDLRLLALGRDSGRQLFVRSRRGVLRFGRHLDRRALDWLRDAVCAMAGLDRAASDIG